MELMNQAKKILSIRLPYYMNLLSQMRMIDDKSVSIMGVNITDKINFFYNSERLQQLFDTNELTTENVTAIMLHEIMHITYNHILRRKKENHKLWNYATDLAINSEISHMIHKKYIRPIGSKCDCGKTKMVVNITQSTVIEFCEDCDKTISTKKFKCKCGKSDLMMSFYDDNFNRRFYCRHCVEKTVLDTEDVPFVLPEFGLFVKDFKAEFPNIEELQSADYYRDLLKSKQCPDCESISVKTNNQDGDQDNKSGQDDQDNQSDSNCCKTCGAPQNDDHEKWDDSEISDELKREVVKNALKRAAEMTEAGKIPKHIERVIRELCKSETPWQKIIRNVAFKTLKTLTTITRSKRNRRLGLKAAGSRKQQKGHIVVAIDTSASLNNPKYFAQFHAELSKLLKYFDITCMDIDTEIHRVYPFNKKTKPNFIGGGGTAYQPAIDKAMELKADVLIYFGDGLCWDNDKLTKPNFPVIWAMVDNYKAPTNWGKLVNIKINEVA